MFPRIAINEADTLAAVEARLTKAIMNNANIPGIKPIYTLDSVKQEAMRLYESIVPKTE